MGGGLMQLVAYGAQDIYLTGNPQITFFKVVYRRHTNFAIETITQTFNSTADFGKKTSVTIARNGDLISRMYLMVKVPKLQQDQSNDTAVDSTVVSWTSGFGNALIKSVSIEIGGQEIDKHYGEWLDIWHELNLTGDQKGSYNSMVLNGSKNIESTKKLGNELTLYVPLAFWFNRNPGLALPLIALQYHEVKLTFDFEEAKTLIRSNNGNINSPKTKVGTADAKDLTMSSCELLVDYIYLDTDERRRFAQVSHEYLIEQVQFTGDESIEANTGNANIDLNFNHPVKSMHWVIQDTKFREVKTVDKINDSSGRDGGNQKLRYSSLASLNDANDTFKTAKLQLNGHDRFVERDADYFRIVQPFQHLQAKNSKYIYTYSFGLKPFEHQPSGTCNFSRVDAAKLSLTFDTSTDSTNTKDDTSTYTGQIPNDVNIKIFGVNYNVLRIMSGMGGLAYSN
tara:strand:- start:73 stop:1431 length:1359 start_codon:yes stop_codon:yes gene_type:complete